MLAVKRDGTIIELSDQAQIVKRSRNMILVIDHGRAFEIFNDCKKRKEILDAYLAEQPAEEVTISHPTQTQQELDDSTQELLKEIEDPKSMAAVPEVQSAPVAPATVEDIDQAQQEEWHPQEAEWYSAEMRHQDAKKHYAILLLSNGQTAFANVASFSSSPGSHCCLKYVPKGTPAMVRLEETPTGLRCLEVKVDGEWNGQDDEATVVFWNDRNIGSAERDCRCNILVIGDFTAMPFAPGDRIRGTFHWNSRRGNWALKNPEKV